jgi:hypothetical protein
MYAFFTIIFNDSKAENFESPYHPHAKSFLVIRTGFDQPSMMGIHSPPPVIFRGFRISNSNFILILSFSLIASIGP